MAALPSDARAGLFGKLPARGDFVRENLPRDFTDTWDAWWQRGLAETQHLPREEWLAAWLESPVWRFILPPGLCGKNGVLEIVIPNARQEEVIRKLVDAAKSGAIGDGKIFVTDIVDAVRIRNDDRGESAI